MSDDVGSLWNKLNDPERFEGAATSTVDAVTWSLIYNDGWYDPAVRARLGTFSDRQLKDLSATLRRKHVNPFVVIAIEDLCHGR